MTSYLFTCLLVPLFICLHVYGCPWSILDHWWEGRRTHLMFIIHCDLLNLTYIATGLKMACNEVVPWSPAKQEPFDCSQNYLTVSSVMSVGIKNEFIHVKPVYLLNLCKICFRTLPKINVLSLFRTEKEKLVNIIPPEWAEEILADW